MLEIFLATNTLILGLIGCFLLFKGCIIPAVVCFITCMAYAYMLSSTYVNFSQGDIIRARYFDLMLTTPIILYLILIRTDLDYRIIYALIVSDLLMVLFAYISNKSRKHPLVYFWLSCLFLAPILYFLARNLNNLTTILILIIWSLYPVIWLLRHNYEISTDTSNQIITIFDILSKGLFGILYCFYL